MPVRAHAGHPRLVIERLLRHDATPLLVEAEALRLFSATFKMTTMSYDIYLKDPVTHETILLDEPHQIRGGTFAIGGTRKAHLNVTYNYGNHFRRLFGENGIRTIYGMTGAESIPLLKAVMEKLGDDVNDDYWRNTEGNAKRALAGLLALAQMRPDGVWDGD